MALDTGCTASNPFSHKTQYSNISHFGPRCGIQDGMDALAAFASLAARNESITLDDPEPLGEL